MYMYTKGSLAGAAAQQQAPRDPPSRVGILTVGRHARHSCYRYTQVAGARNDKTHLQNGGLQLGSPATCKLKSFRGFYGFREDIREARALREIDQSVVSAAIRVSSVQNIKTS